MPEENMSHHIVLIVFLALFYLGFLFFVNALIPFLNLSNISWYIIVGIISLIAGTAIFRLFHETDYSQRQLFHIYIIINSLMTALFTLHVLAIKIIENLNAQMTELSAMGSGMPAGAQIISLFGTFPDPYIMAAIGFSCFNLFFFAHLLEQKRERDIAKFMIPFVIFVILSILVTYVVNNLMG